MTERALTLVVLELVGCASDGAPEPGGSPNLLVLAPDTLRADCVLGTSDGAPPVATHLAALAARGVTFESAWTQGAWTLPALSSLLRGRYPNAVDAAKGEAGWFTEGQRTLPEILGYYGYHTAVFWGPTLPGSIAAFSRGFGTASSTPPDVAPCDDVLAWLQAGPPEPFFAFVHDLDLHVAPLDGGLQGSGLTGPGAGNVRAAMRELYTHDYDVSVRRFDDGVGRVLAWLDKSGLAERTVVVVVSNHGEDLLEHTQIPDHGILYGSVLHVPLVMVDPAMEAPRRVSEPVRLVDMAPTLLERLGVPADAGMDGASLLPLMRGEADHIERQPLFALSNPDNVALRTGSLALLACSGSGCRSGAPGGHEPGYQWFEAYDLDVDPGEQHDVFDERAETLLRPLLQLFAWREARVRDTESAETWNIEASERRALKDQGYWGLVAPE